MSEQNSGSNRPQGGGGNNNNRRHHHNRNRRPQGQGGQNPGGQGQQQASQPRPQGQGQGQQGHQGPQGAAQGSSQGPNQGSGQQPRSQGQRRRHRGGQNRNRSQGQGQGQAQGQNQGQGQQQHGFNLERVYEKYLNLLDQHLIARRKYHDMFYRAEPSQKAKLERNFYNTLNDVREFENRLSPEARELFEKRNNGLRPDTIYTTNHQITDEEKIVVSADQVEDPHFLQSQQAADYSGDTEESVGTVDDYLKYKNLV